MYYSCFERSRCRAPATTRRSISCLTCCISCATCHAKGYGFHRHGIICKGVMLRSDHLLSESIPRTASRHDRAKRQSGGETRASALAFPVPPWRSARTRPLTRSTRSKIPRCMPCSHPDSFDPSESRPRAAVCSRHIPYPQRQKDPAPLSVLFFRAKRKRFPRSESHLNIPNLLIDPSLFPAFSKPFF